MKPRAKYRHDQMNAEQETAAGDSIIIKYEEKKNQMVVADCRFDMMML
jgi:hypothetical protein